MEHGERKDDDNNVEFGGPWGFWMKTRSRHFINFIMIVITFGGGFAALAYLLYEHRMESEKTGGVLATNQGKLDESIQELIYVNSLTPEERAKLNLAMPDSLRKKMRRPRDEEDKK